MPRYNVDNVPVWPCRVFDANGLEWLYVVEFDTETGEVTYVATDANGNLIATDDGHLLRRTVKTAAPLTFIPFSNKE